MTHPHNLALLVLNGVGRFDNSKWVKEAPALGQGLEFCAVLLRCARRMTQPRGLLAWLGLSFVRQVRVPLFCACFEPKSHAHTKKGSTSTCEAEIALLGSKLAKDGHERRR